MENLDNAVELMEMSKKRTVLFVEDSLALQRQIERFLKKFFKEVYVGSNGEEGLALFKEKSPDVVVTDLTMPKMNGHDMSKAIKEINPDVEVIILSAHSDNENLIRSLHVGVSDFIQKPANVTKMIDVFLKVLGKIERRNVCATPIEDEKKIQDNTQETLQFVFSNNIQVDLINHYRGIPIINSAKIIDLHDNVVVLKTNHMQLMAIKYENGTTIDSSLMNKDIDCKLISYDVDSYEVRLQVQKIYFPPFKKREEVRVEPDEKFKAFVL
jgi:YesN/AraC family two-component response regulator